MNAATTTTTTSNIGPNREDLLDTLRQVIDPELGLNIVDLGLIYGLVVDGPRVRVRMTLTTPGCPMGPSIAWGVESALLNRPDVEVAEVEWVWDPPWTPDLVRPGAGV